jgi:hypothetical protein
MTKINMSQKRYQSIAYDFLLSRWTLVCAGRTLPRRRRRRIKGYSSVPNHELNFDGGL